MPHSIAASNGQLALCHSTSLKFGKFDALNQTVEVPAVPEASVKDAKLNYFDLVQFSPCGQYIVAVNHFGKTVCVFNDKMELLSSRVFPKRPSAMAVTSDAIFVGDKFGDIYQVPLLSTEAIVDAKGASLIEPILGHVSMLLDVVIYNQQIITSDRDEHIKVSSLAHPYVIDSFFFGHEQYVSQMLVSKDILVSGGGDSFVCAWDLKTGEKLAQLDLKAYAENQDDVNVSAIVEYTDSVLILIMGSTSIIRANLATLEVMEVIETGDKLTALATDGDKIYAASAEKLCCSSLPWAPETQEFTASEVPLFTQGSLRKQPEH